MWLDLAAIPSPFVFFLCSQAPLFMVLCALHAVCVSFRLLGCVFSTVSGKKAGPSLLDTRACRASARITPLRQPIWLPVRAPANRRASTRGAHSNGRAVPARTLGKLTPTPSLSQAKGNGLSIAVYRAFGSVCPSGLNELLCAPSCTWKYIFLLTSHHITHSKPLTGGCFNCSPFNAEVWTQDREIGPPGCRPWHF